MFLWQTFFANVAPIFIVAGLGYWLGRRFDLDAAPLSRIVFYLLGPALVFDLIVGNTVHAAEIGQVTLLTLGGLGLVALAAWLVGRALRLERAALAALLLVSVFPNAGNYGLPLIGFAFGQQAQALAGIYFILTAILFNTVGVLVASLGRMGWLDALRATLRVPMVYAVLAGLALQMTGWQLPEALSRSVDLLSAGAIPAMLLLLGLELRKATFIRREKMLAAALVLRLLLSPALVGLAAWAWMGAVSPMLLRAVLLEAAMPTAVSTTVLALEYHLDGAFVSMTVLVSTLLSLLSVTFLLAFLGS